MEKNFNFNKIGKQLPYRTPDAFFEKMQTEVVKRVCDEKPKKRYRIKWIFSTSLAVAAMLLGILFLPTTSPEAEQLPAPSLMVAASPIHLDYSIDEYLEEISDDELEECMELSENDIFIN